MKKLLISTLMILTLGGINMLSAKSMEMFDTDGKSYKINAVNDEFKIKEAEGKVVFLEFFGLNCPACQATMPHLINLKEKYKDSIKIMAIEVQKHDVDPINAYKKMYGINYTTFSNYDVGDVVRYIADSSGWKGAIPFTVIIDAKGIVQFVEAGIISEDKLNEYVEKFSK